MGISPCSTVVGTTMGHTIASPVTHVPSLLYAKQPRPPDLPDTTGSVQRADVYMKKCIETELIQATNTEESLEFINPIYGCLNASLRPVSLKKSLKRWEDFIPASTGLSTEKALQSLQPSLEEIQAFLRAENQPASASASAKWGGETTNLSLVIDPKLHMFWYPIDPRTSSNAMYVRASYITATEIIFAYYLGQSNDAPIVLTGTSGTGKTMFSNVFIWRLLSSAMDVNLQSAVAALNVSGGVSSGDQNAINPYKRHPIVLWRASTGEGFAYIANQFYICPYGFEGFVRGAGLLKVVQASGQRAWLITDTEPIQGGYMSRYINQIYIVSTGSSEMGERKAFTRLAGVSLIARIWSFGEVKELFELSFADERFVKWEKVKLLYSLCGGVPRTLFNLSGEFTYNHDGRLDLSLSLLRRLSTADWNKIFRSIGDASENDFDHQTISSMLFHTVPREVPRELYGSMIYKRSITKWASPWMATEALSRLHLEGQKQSALFCLSGKSDYRSAALVGYVFEGLCFSILTRSSEPMTCKLRLLSPKANLTDESGRRVDLRKFLLLHGFHQVQLIPKPKVNTELIPLARRKRSATNRRGRKVSPIGQVTSALARQLRPREPKPEFLSDEVVVQFPSMELQQFSLNSEIEQSSPNETSRLWVPKNRFYEGIDAVMPNESICLQMTTSPSRPVSVTNVVDIIDQERLNSEFEEGVLLLFVVPKERYPAFTKAQALTNLRDNETADSVGQWLVQAVVGVDLEKEYDQSC